MATARKTRRVVLPPAETAAAHPNGTNGRASVMRAAAELESSSMSPTDRLAAVLEQFGGGGGYRAYVERVDSADGPEYLGALPLDADLYQRVRDKWGGGRYGARIVDGSSKYMGRVPPFRVAGKPRDDSDDPPPAAAARAQSAPQPLAEIVSEQLATLRADLLAELERRTATPPANPLETALALMRAARELTPPPAAAPPPAPARDSADVLDMFNTLLELQERLRPPPGGGGGVGEVLREFAPIFKQAIERENPPPPPTGDTAMVRARTAAPPAPSVAGWLRPFIGWKRQLLALADAGKDPALYADLLADNITDEQADAVVAADAAGTLEQDLFGAVPELGASAERRTFAGKLLAELRAALGGTSDDAPAAGGSSAGASSEGVDS